MGSRQAYIKADLQKKLELDALNSITQIYETMNMVTDGFIDAVIDAKAGGLESERLQKLIRALLNSNREWKNDMSAYIRIAGKYRVEHDKSLSRNV